MKFHVLTLFPEMIRQGMDTSILKRAMENGLFSVDCINIRDYTNEKHGSVDDYPYGGGAGMLMQAQPVYDAWKSIPAHASCKTIYVSPKGKPFCQEMAGELAEQEELIILCGHYEGVDERVLEKTGAIPVSLGDYVLTGGELPAMVMMDCIARLIPGVLGKLESSQYESFHADLLEYPQYSRPAVWEGMAVPDVLLGGNHKEVCSWRQKESEKITKRLRPDLYEKYLARKQALAVLGKKKRENACIMDVLINGEGTLLGVEGKSYLVYVKSNKGVMFFGESDEEGEKLLPYIPKDVQLVCTNQAGLLEKLEKKFGLECGIECYQSVYTKKEKLPVQHKDIRMLTMDDYEYVSNTYEEGKAKAYVKHRIQHESMFGAYVDGKLAGFCGVHRDGSLGMLYIEPEYRRYHLGSSLASYLVNISLERGGVPYAHIHTDNEKSLKMQAYMGLYLSKKVIYWLFSKK